MISCRFHASRPYEKLLTEITGFVLQDKWMYLSAIIGCLSKMVFSWTIGNRPNCNRANHMSNQVISDLQRTAAPLCHQIEAAILVGRAGSNV